MTEGRSTFDQRFDPRFQRGYVQPEGEVETRRETHTLEERPSGPGETSAISATLERPAPPPRSPRIAAPAARPHESVRSDAVQPDRRPETVLADSHPADPGGPGGRPNDGDRLVTTRWLWLVLAAALVFIVAGVALAWNIWMTRNPFVGTRSDEDLFVDTLLQLVPSVVTVGVLGVVGVLLVWALTTRRGTGA